MTMQLRVLMQQVQCTVIYNTLHATLTRLRLSPINHHFVVWEAVQAAV